MVACDTSREGLAENKTAPGPRRSQRVSPATLASIFFFGTHIHVALIVSHSYTGLALPTIPSQPTCFSKLGVLLSMASRHILSMSKSTFPLEATDNLLSSACRIRRFGESRNEVFRRFLTNDLGARPHPLLFNLGQPVFK